MIRISPLALIASFALFAAFGLTGCATAPPAPQGEEVWGLLPEGNSLYLSVHVARDPALYRELLDLTGRQGFAQAVERIDRIYLAANPFAAPEPEFAAAVAGRIPRQYIRFRLAREDGWTERDGRIEGRGFSWWDAADSRLQLALPAGNFLAAASEGVEEMLRRYARRDSAGLPPAGLPPDMAREAESRDIFCYLPEPARALESLLPPPLRRVPLERAWFAIDRIPSAEDGPEAYAMSGIITLSRERDALALLVLFRLTAAAWLRERGVAPSEDAYRLVDVERRNRSLIFTGGPVGRDAVLLLLAGLPIPRPAAAR